VPAQRHYQVFERLGRRHNVYVIQFDIFRSRSKPTYTPRFVRIIRPFTIGVSDFAKFYAANFVFHGKKILSTIKEFDIEIVFGSNLAVCTLAFELGKLFGLKSIFDLSDFFPASVGAYYPKASRISASLLRSLTTLITMRNIKVADLCTTCSDTLKQYIIKIAPNSRVERFPNGVDTTIFLPRPPSESLKKEIGIGDNCLVYAGSIESWLDFTVVFDALSILKKEGIDIQLLIIGRSIYSEKKDSLIREIENRGLNEQVKFVGYQPYERLPDFINVGIGGLIPFKVDSLLTQMAFPNKLLEYLACGKPVFAPPMRELIKVGGEYLLPYTSPKTLALQIRKAISSNYNPDEIRKSVLNYDWNIITDKLETLMQKLVR
jgi:glycosyltransferase involved in cell wall biosynthesis